MNTARNRLWYIDNLRGILILIVIFGHCIQYIDAHFDNNLIFRYIYAFHMPLFMYISGFVSYKVAYSMTLIKRRAVQLLIPFVAWAMLGMTLSGNYNWNWLIRPDNGLWFLWVLFWIGTIHISMSKLSDRLCIKREYLLGLVCIVFLGITVITKLKFGFHLVSWYLPFYLLGVWTRKNESKLWAFLDKIKWILLALFVLGGFFWMRNENPTFLPGSSQIITFAYKFIIGIIGCFCFIAVFRGCNRKIIVLSELGGGMTLGIYAIHQTVLQYILKYKNSLDIKDFALWIDIGVAFLITCMLTLVVYYIFNQTPLTRKLFIGK